MPKIIGLVITNFIIIPLVSLWRQRKLAGVVICLSLCLGLVLSFRVGEVSAAVDLLKQPVAEVKISLGNSENELRFIPDRLEFEAGKRYKLVLHNPSDLKHYFTDKDFASAIWTQKVEAGQVEVKGAVQELELKPGATAEWHFIAMKSGTFPLHCSVPGHAEAGMKGTVMIASFLASK